MNLYYHFVHFFIQNASIIYCRDEMKKRKTTKESMQTDHDFSSLEHYGFFLQTFGSNFQQKLTN